MKDPISYYKEDFGRELLMVQNAPRGTSNDRISITSIVPDEPFTGMSGETSRAFKKLPYPRLFLFAYFFTALIDQAIHSALREEHSFFHRFARYPKFVGILATYDHNLHPGLLLLAATLYTPKEEEGLATEQFHSLAHFFAEDYADFIVKNFFQIDYPAPRAQGVRQFDAALRHQKFLNLQGDTIQPCAKSTGSSRYSLNKYPTLTGRLETEQSRNTAVRKLYLELSSAVAILFIPQSLRPYSSLSPNIKLYERWMDYFRTKVNRKIQQL